MNVLILPLCVMMVGGAFCSNAAGALVTARSSSQQFVAREIQDSTVPATATEPVRKQMGDGWAFLLVSHKNPSGTDETNLELDPSLLVVTCERLKDLFLTELGVSDQWQGRVTLTINPKLAQTQRPRLTAVYHPDGWSYSLDLPKTISTRLLVRALMDTLLLEMANRGAETSAMEIPFWLVEGMSAHLQNFNLPTVLLQPSEQMSGNRVKLAGMDLVRNQLRRRPPLSFQELSWPTNADVDGDSADLYRACAQLFLEQLLEFRDGKHLIREMLRQLPKHHNWQTAFLSAFRPHFKQLLDVEKWWGLSAIDFAKGDLAEPLTLEACGKELQDALDVPVQVHFAAKHMPAEAKLTLQEVITKWPAADAASALERCMDELRFLHFRASPDYRPLVDQYLKVLAGYLVASREPGLEWTVGKNHPSVLTVLKSDTAKQLDALDRQRYARRPQVTASATAPN